ncbi:ectomycorrhiza-regulated esterase [Obba rivulosa]|uniref:Ectomycorrhiza-regulated esterase n=1 Tax=Obba rivulosa TaxID=1052685 RepID=A0A8E2B4X7_9APHY|nr:ectomycorrhiza-regulated esterase [Obba rivulosa]
MPAPITTKKTTRHTIILPGAPDKFVVGVLEQVCPDEPTQGRKLALILHGAMGHKDYLYQKRLAHRLPLDSFRLDFRGNHESPGPWLMDGFSDDYEDIEASVAYLQEHFGYVVDLVVGHSRGSVVGMWWISSSKAARNVRGYVNASGRYRMRVSHNQSDERHGLLKKQGWFEERQTVARKPFRAIVTLEQLEAFARFNSAHIWEDFPAATHVLTLHGLADQVVPVYDAVIYARALGARSPGTHNLHLIEKADHNFTGMQDDVIATILKWWDHLERGKLKTGIWQTGVRPKL